MTCDLRLRHAGATEIIQPELEAASTLIRHALRRLFDLACAEYDKLDLDHDDPVADLDVEFARGLEGVTEPEVRARLVKIERLLTEWSGGRKLYGHLFDDVLKLKYFHQRYTNYLRWLTFQG